jgi:hypothetical protein
MIRREAFMNKIREIGFTYKTQQKRTTLWRQSGTTNYISMPMKDWLEDEYVQYELRKGGCSQQDIDSFFASCKS